MNYYVPKITDDEKYPLLFPANEETDDATCLDDYIDPSFIALFRTDKYAPKNFRLGDYNDGPVISDRLKNVLELFNLPCVQYVNAHIVDSNKKIADNFWYLHVTNYIACIDRQQSEYKVHFRRTYDFDKLCLDEKRLNSINITNRTLFRLKEYYMIFLWEESLVKAVMDSFEPDGFVFKPLEESFFSGSFTFPEEET